MQQAARISDKCAFFLVGDLIEFGETEQVFSMPKAVSYTHLYIARQGILQSTVGRMQ